MRVPWRQLGERVAGVDEAGRGPLAGPVVVAAVILDPRRRIGGLADSKQLSEKRREELEQHILAKAVAHAVVVVDAASIDRHNIFQATMLGMARALATLSPAPEIALVDGNKLPKQLCCPARAIVGGDAHVAPISAASILAKTHRDRLMRAFDAEHPGYGFAIHKGYPTPEHLAALSALGPCPIHRRSFGPVANLLNATASFDFS